MINTDGVEETQRKSFIKEKPKLTHRQFFYFVFSHYLISWINVLIFTHKEELGLKKFSVFLIRFEFELLTQFCVFTQAGLQISPPVTTALRSLTAFREQCTTDQGCLRFYDLFKRAVTSALLWIELDRFSKWLLCQIIPPKFARVFPGTILKKTQVVFSKIIEFKVPLHWWTCQAVNSTFLKSSFQSH